MFTKKQVTSFIIVSVLAGLMVGGWGTLTARASPVFDVQRMAQGPVDTAGQMRIAFPKCGGTVVRVGTGTSTTSATGTTVNGKLYKISVRGVGAHCIWGATATTTTGFGAPVDSVWYEQATGTSLSCITVAGTGEVFATPCNYSP